MGAKQDHVTFVRNMTIELGRLNFQYIPRQYSPELYYGGSRPMSINSSPHFRFLQSLLKSENLLKTDYCKWLRFLGKKESVIPKKVSAFVKLFRSIERYGFTHNKTSLVILKSPFVHTRYSIELPFDNSWEIWHGHHRLTCCLLLGYKNIDCQLFKDSFPGSKQSKFGDI